MYPRVIISTVAVVFFLVMGGAQAATMTKNGGKVKALAYPTSPNRAASNAPKFVEGQVLVGFLPGTAPQARAEAHGQAGGRLIRRLQQLNVDVVSVASGAVLSSIAAYQRNPNVRYAEPNYLRRLDLLPSEGTEAWPYGGTIDFMAEQWGLNNTGQPLFYDQYSGTLGALKGTADADIDFAEAWTHLSGKAVDAGIVVAVIDSGVDCTHEDLQSKCIDQQNFGQSTYGQADIIGHGTHVAGTAAAVTGNGRGTAGVGWNARVADIKVCYEEIDYLWGIVYGLCDDAAIAAGLTYAADHNYHIASMSLAGPDPGTTVGNAVNYALSKGMLIVAGAGNEYTQTRMYPAAFSGVVAVGATDYFDNLASFSSFGKDWVHILAPGVNIISSVSTEACGEPNCYGWNSGTSMATPHVSGAAALVWGRMKALNLAPTNTAVRDVLLNSADATGALGQNFPAWVAKGRLNLNNAVLLAESGTPPPPPPPGGNDTTPPVITNVGSTITSRRTGSFTIYWTTNEPATSEVFIAGEWKNDPNTSFILTTSHERYFTGATKGASYPYTVRSTDAAGNYTDATGVHQQ